MKINFYKFNIPAIIFSILIILFTLILIFIRGFNFGTEFTGGIEVRVNLNQNLNASTIISQINDESNLNISAEAITSSDKNTFVIRHPLIEDNAVKTEKTIITRLNEVFPDTHEITQTTLIGATVGEENKNNAILLSLTVIIAIIFYLTFRFKFLYGFSAVIAVIHDVMIMLCIVLLFEMEMNVLVIVAIMTTFGYSVNDTIIFFDRVRDESRYFHNDDYRQLLTLSLNNVFVRTLITSATTFIVVLALFLSTEGAYRDFALLLMIGVITGTYSSIYIVGPLMLFWNKRVRKQL